METFVIGDPVTGLIEATSVSLSTAQLTGWGKTTADEGRFCLLARPWATARMEA